MASPTQASWRSGNPEGRAVLRARLLRAAVLLIVGIAIAFTATLHRDTNFDRWALSASLLAIGAVTVIEFFALRPERGSWLVATRAAMALIAGGAMLAAVSPVAISFTLVIWAAASALITVVRVSQGSQARNVGVPSALLSGALAVLVLLFRDDLIAVIGFFGAYAIVRAVFLGISAFDARGNAPVELEDIEPGDDTFAPAN